MFLLLLALGGGGAASANGFHLFHASKESRRISKLEARVTMLELAARQSAPPVLRGVSQAPGPQEGFTLGKHKLTPRKDEPVPEKLPARTPKTLGGERRPPQPYTPSAFQEKEHGEYIFAKSRDFTDF